MNKAKKAIILDGKAIADKIQFELKNKIADQNPKPGLAAVLVGNDPASELYVGLKEKAALAVGIEFHKYICNEKCYSDIFQKELIDLIKFLNRDEAVDAIIVQLPLPEKYDQQKIINAISPQKDVDGFHPKNKTGLVPPTIAAIIELLKATNEKLETKKTLVIGQSDIFLDGIKKYLKRELKINKIKTSQAIPADSSGYEIIIIALGQAKALKKSMVKNGAIVIDVGISRVADKTVGDVDQRVADVAGFVSPVPGGVGPITVACLLRNTYLLSSRAATRDPESFRL